MRTSESIPDRTRYEALVQAHHVEVFRAARRVLADDADALDATQQTFLRLLEGRLELGAGEPGRVLRWVAVREALSLLRSQQSRRKREEGHAMGRHESHEDRGIEARELGAVLRRLVERLPDELRLAVALRFQEELSYAEIGRALGISEPGAHERVKRGLEQLRRGAEQAGFAGALVLPVAEGDAATQWIELLGRGAPARVPPGLEAALLALERVPAAAAAVGAASSAGWPLAAGAVLAAVCAGAWLAGAFDGAPSDELARAVQPVGPLAPEATASSGAPPGASRGSVQPRVALDAPAPLSTPGAATEARAEGAWPTSVLTGRVLDRSGLPVPDAAVLASSTEREGKLSTFSHRTSTDARGAFEFALRYKGAGQDYVVRTWTATALVDSPPVRIGPRAPEPLVLHLDPEPDDRPGAFTLEVLVVDPAGAALSDVRVDLLGHHARASGSWFQRDDTRTTDGRGIARFEGERLGAKLLRVDARSRGFALLREAVPIGNAGFFEAALRLEPGLALSGSVVDADGMPVAVLDLHAWRDDPNEWYEATLTEPGRFVVEGLGSGEFVLSSFGSRGWSAFELRGVRAGRSDLELVVKRASDERDVGLHAGEIHGRAVDARTGAPVLIPDEARLLTHRVDAAEIGDGDLAPLVLHPPTYQTMDGFGEPPPPEPGFHLGGLEPGTWVVALDLPGWLNSVSAPITLARDDVRTGIVIPLDAGVPLEGRVRDAGGAPVAGARVAAIGLGAASHRWIEGTRVEIDGAAGQEPPSFRGTRTDAQGFFRLAAVPTLQPIQLVAFLPGRAPALSGRIELPAAGVELRFTAGD